MEHDRELAVLVEAIGVAQQRYEQSAFDESSTHAPGAPASEAAIRGLEDRLGAPLPGDYRLFLSLHDGWDHFHGDGKLLATGDQDAGWVRKKIAFWSDLWPSEDANPFLRGALPLMLGESLHHFIVLDPHRRDPSGAASIVEFDSMQERTVYENFTAVLRSELAVLEGLIDRELHGLPQDDDALSAAPE